MCGIAGIINAGETSRVVAQMRSMIDSLARRGPDGEGIEAWPNAVLGHRRLAIFDLSDAGRQPMLSQDGSLGVVFNGAIYNFRDLRLELESRGCEFKSQTDTEVLLHGYREWGVDDLVNRLRGMFAIGLWDDDSRKLFLIRDRLGVKPLVYAVTNGELAFASTVRALRVAGFVSEIDDRAVAEFLEFGYVTDDRSIYRGANKVVPASIVEWSDGKISSRKYWSAPSAQPAGTISFEHAVEETEHLLLKAVEKRLFADVPVGALLSGGIDSSLICWAAAKLGQNVTAYTVGTPGESWDETCDARKTADKLGISHQVLEITSADPPAVTDLVNAYAEPFACASALGMMRVSRTVASEATVLLTGDGGDDVFLGYPEHRHFWLAQQMAQNVPTPSPGAWLAIGRALPRRGLLRRAGAFMDYVTGGLGAVTANHDGLPFYTQAGMLGERLVDLTLPQREIMRSRSSAQEVLTEFLAYDLKGRFVAEYLTKVDGATMYYSLEARSPFLDQDLWEFGGSLPYDIRLRRLNLKAVLRELARRKVGDRVAAGQKRGFTIPVQSWITDRWRPDLVESLRTSMLDEQGWICAGSVLAALEKTPTRSWAPKQFWYLFVLEAWLKKESEGVFEPAPESRPVIPVAPSSVSRDAHTNQLSEPVKL
jgi:asparagine synthase (glutamine-hydrolysing)